MMNDIFYEQETPIPAILSDKLKLITSFIAVICLICWAFVTRDPFVIAAASIALLAFYVLIWLRRNRDYEYEFTNSLVTISIIYNKERRSDLASFDLRNCRIVNNISGFDNVQILNYTTFLTNQIIDSKGFISTNICALYLKEDSEKSIILLEADDKAKGIISIYTEK